MVQAVNRPPLTAESNCGGQSGTGTGFSHITSAFPCQISFFTSLSTCYSYRKDKRPKPGNFPKCNALNKSKSTG